MLRYVLSLMARRGARNGARSQTPRARCGPGLEGLERRGLMATLAGTSLWTDLAALSASTPDSRQVQAQVEVRNRPAPGPVEVAVYRSSDARFAPSDIKVASAHLTATSVGQHGLTIPIPGGLGINPQHPYVLVVADPDGRIGQADRTNDVAAFRKYAIAVTTHGGLQDNPGDRIPAWQNRLNAQLTGQGYDRVIGYNWEPWSNTPGQVVPMGRRLAGQIRDAVASVPAGMPVDLHLIGHSQGSVVNTVAIQSLEQSPIPALEQGFLRHTMLDPHAANNGFPRPQYSTKPSFMGGLARQLINRYQSQARDPFAAVPASVDASDVYYQHTYFAMAQGTQTYSQWFNLWGQVPVKGPGTATYIDITGPGISHSGDYSVVDWYTDNVVPGLGQGREYAYPDLVTATLHPDDGVTRTPEARRPSPLAIHRNGRLDQTLARTHTPRFAGTAPPGSMVQLIGSVGEGSRIQLGQTTSDPSGRWELTSRSLPNGQYRLVALGKVPASPRYPQLHSTPRVPLGTLIVDTTGRRVLRG